MAGMVDKEVAQWSLYGGTSILAFNPTKHLYQLDGKPVDGVTTGLKIINKPALIMWGINMTLDHLETELKPGIALDEVQIMELLKAAKWAHRRKSEGAADMGTFVHAFNEAYILHLMGQGPEPVLPHNPQLRQACEQFLAFWKANDIVPLAVERPVASRKHGIAGTPDLKCIFNGRRAILDWKTGSGIYTEAIEQMGAYAICDEEESEFVKRQETNKKVKGAKIELLVVVNCSVKNEFNSYITDKVDRAKAAYLSALELYRLHNAIDKELKAA